MGFKKEIGQVEMILLKKLSSIYKMSVFETTSNVTMLQTTSVAMETAEDDDNFLFATLHGYHITLGLVIVSMVMVFLGIWIIILNCLLIHTLMKYRAHLDVTDTFIHSLALTDAILGLLLLYNCTYNVVNFQNRYECLTRFGLIQAMLINSTGHISLLTINRYIKIIKPLVYRQIFKKSRMIILSGSVWTFSLVFGLSPLMGWSKKYIPSADDETHTVCRYFGVTKPEFVAVNVSLYWIPLIIMVLLYSQMGKVACRHSKQITLQERRGSICPESRIFDSRSWRFTKTVLIIIGVYFFCWMPTGIFFMIQWSGALHHHNLTELGDILTFTTSLGFLNSLLNPIIYATKIPCVKQRFKQVFCCSKTTEQFPQSVSIYVTKSTEKILNSNSEMSSVTCDTNGMST